MARVYTLQDADKKTYLSHLLHDLTVLKNNVSSERPVTQLDQIKDFGNKLDWDWNQLPTYEDQYTKLASVIERVGNNYSWLQTIDIPGNEANRGCITEINLSADTGLPWMHDFVNLHQKKRSAKSRLSDLPDYDALTIQVIDLLYGDEFSREEIDKKVGECRWQALNRSFYEQIREKPLVGWKAAEQHITVTQTQDFGPTSQWRVEMIRFNGGSGFFDYYSIDLWQDKQEELIRLMGNTVVVDPVLRKQLAFADKNPAHFMITSLDKQFPSIHPVHALKAIIGPYENKYMTTRNKEYEMREMHNIAKTILKDDKSFRALRMDVQYSFAPNAKYEDGEQRQDVFKEDWLDRLIVVPGKYAATVADAVRGYRVRIFES